MSEGRPPSVKRLEQTTSGWGLGPSPLPELLPVAYFMILTGKLRLTNV